MQTRTSLQNACITLACPLITGTSASGTNFFCCYMTCNSILCQTTHATSILHPAPTCLFAHFCVYLKAMSAGPSVADKAGVVFTR